MAGVAMWTIAIPPDVLKSRLQSAPAGTYKGVADVLRVLLKNEGPQALFKGLGPAMLRAFPANAAYVHLFYITLLIIALALCFDRSIVLYALLSIANHLLVCISK